MPYYFFVWDGENERHLAEHGVTIEEFAEVVCDPDRLEDPPGAQSRSATPPRESTWPAFTNFLTMTRDTVYAISACEPGE